MLLAQSATPATAFEVAAVKVNKSSEPESGSFQHGRLTINSATLRHLIGAAYDVRIDLVAGGRSWVDTDRFDIDAKADPKTSEATSRVMLQGLLAERFKLKVHSEKRLRRVFLLTVAKGGPKLRESPTESPERSRCAGTAPLTCYKRTMADLADVLPRISSGIDIPVVDETGLKSRYDFTLAFAQPPGHGETGASPEASYDGGVSIFDALRQQLGLKLKSAKRSIEFLVIDRVERVPTGN